MPPGNGAFGQAEPRDPPRVAPAVRDALAFVEQHGVVLASAKGNAPRLVEAILGAPITGNWWSHPRGSYIYNVLAAVCDSPDVLTCRLLRGKVTLVHRRLWPALVRAAECLDPAQLAQVRDEHMPNGRHRSVTVPFPAWVPDAVRAQADRLTQAQALAALGPGCKRSRRASQAMKVPPEAEGPAARVTARRSAR
jgi:hypothetical protein